MLCSLREYLSSKFEAKIIDYILAIIWHTFDTTLWRNLLKGNTIICLTWRSRYEGTWADLGYIDLPVSVHLVLSNSLWAQFELVGRENKIQEKELDILKIELSIDELGWAYRVACDYRNFLPVNPDHDADFIHSLGVCDPVVARQGGEYIYYIRTSLVLYNKGFVVVTLSFLNSITFEYYLNLLHLPAQEFCNLLVIDGAQEYFEETSEWYTVWYPKNSLRERLNSGQAGDN